METAIENKIVRSGTTITTTLSEKFDSILSAYANERGIKREDALNELAETALKSNQMMQGKVVEVAPEILGLIKQIQIDGLREFDKEKETVKQHTLQQQPVVNENEISFVAIPEIKELIVEINKRRVIRGLAPVEKSLAELLFHWGENLSDHSVFGETTGLKYDWYKSFVRDIALTEREQNNSQSNVIEGSGIFGRMTIINTEA